MSLSRVAIAVTGAMVLSLMARPVQAQPAPAAPTAAPAPAGAPAPIAAPPPPAPPPPPPAAPITPTPTIPPPPTAAATAAVPPAAPAVKGAAGAPASGTIISGYGVTGQLVDPSDRIQALLESIAPIGSAFIESGPADRIGTPIGTIPRLTQSLDSIGYASKVRPIPSGGRVQMAVEVHPYIASDTSS